MSRSGLVLRTGLSRSAIRGLISEFAAAGLVGEERAAPRGGPGRPSPLVQPASEQAMVLAVDIQVDSLAVARVGFGGRVLGRLRVDRPRGPTPLEGIVEEVATLLARVSRPDDQPLGIGVAVAGVVRRDDGLVSTAPNLGWVDGPLGDRLTSRLQVDAPIVVANDADLGALAEWRRGAAQGADDVVFVSGEVGVGGGIIAGGRPLTGAAGYAGEIGHMPVNPSGSACRCGSFGCWETEVGEDALLRQGGHRAGGGRAEVEALLAEAAQDDARALAAIAVVGRWLAFGLAGLVNIFDPRVVVLGGLFGRLHPWFAGTLEAELDRLALPAPRRLVRVVPAALGVDAPLLGAAELALEPFLADPAAWMRARAVQPLRLSA